MAGNLKSALRFATVLFVASVLPFQGSPRAEQPTIAPPIVRTEGVYPVSRHVHVIPDNSALGVPNIGIIVGTEGVLVIDTGLGAANGAAVAAVAQRLAPDRKIWLAATHAHPEHDLGAGAFPSGTIMIRSKDQETDQTSDMKVADAFRMASPEIANMLQGAQFRHADITFDQSYMLDLGGGVTVQMVALGANHTDGDTAFWVSGDRVLFSGDTAMKGPPLLSTEKATLARWFVTLDGLEALQPQIVVPSHGPLGGVELIQGYRAYFREVHDRTATAKAAGKSVDEAVTEVADAMSGRYPVRAYLEAAARMAYRSN